MSLQPLCAKRLHEFAQFLKLDADHHRRPLLATPLPREIGGNVARLGRKAHLAKWFEEFSAADAIIDENQSQALSSESGYTSCPNSGNDKFVNSCPQISVF